VDLSAKYLWSRIGGKSANVVGDTIDFKAINSHRLRVGAMFNRQYSDSWNLAMGIAYEQEFDSKAKASTNGANYNFAIDAPNVRGGTGILTLKASTQPAFNKDLRVDLSLDAYTGKRHGLGAKAKLSYAF